VAVAAPTMTATIENTSWSFRMALTVSDSLLDDRQ
jgi:hypothetical protein